MKKLSTLFGILLVGLSLTAQENLVPNPSFEEVEGKIKEGGLIEMAYPWKSVTMNPVDLYSKNAKTDEFAVPENKNGLEEANTGTNYAGITAFGFGGRIPRTYLGTTLSKELEAGKVYCMKFNVSLSDYSKFAVNNLAMYVAKEEMSMQKDGILELSAQIKSMKNKAEGFEQQFLWTPVCGVYEATGGETFIAIGNFNANTETEQLKIRLSREFSGKRQTNSAYYFIDDVSVIELDEKTIDDCLCDKIAGGKMKTEFKSFGTDKNKRATAKTTYILNSDGTKAKTAAKAKTEEAKTEFNLETADIFFLDKSTKPTAESIETISKIAEYLKTNKEAKIKLTGHSDATESEKASIDRSRAFSIKKKLIAMGISDSRISYFAAGTKESKKSGDAALNRRVSISLN